MKMPFENIIIMKIYKLKMVKIQADTFFCITLTGVRQRIDYSISTLKMDKRNPYDVLAGIELQGAVLTRPMDWMPY